jgi:ATP-dependent DNA helicase DinG
VRFFEEDGPLAVVVGERYRYRPAQVELASDIADACKRGGTVVLGDAKTGTGKSFAYLVPIALAGERVVVSTAGKVLQRQLISKDLPTLAKAMHEAGGKPPSFALLKGRDNFLCSRRFEEFSTGDTRATTDATFDTVAAWARSTETGDVEELEIPAPPWWSEIASDRDDCTRKHCPRCFYFSHRDRAVEADILVVNHHLLVANIASDEAVFALADRHLVVDEAHEITAVMRDSLGLSVTRKRINYVCTMANKRAADLGEQTGVVRNYAESFFDELHNCTELFDPDQAPPSYRPLADTLASLESRLAANPREEVNALAATVRRALSDLATFYRPEDDTLAYAVEVRSGTPALRAWLIEPGAVFRGVLERAGGKRSTVLVSATLAVAGSFTYARGELGIDLSRSLEVVEHLGPEVFDYGAQALAYIATDLPSPERGDIPRHTEASIYRAAELVRASRGRALILCATRKAVEAFRGTFDSLAYPYPVRYQGDDSPGRLVEWLKSSDGGVLVATRSFWQGVDVLGEALSLVVLDKVPFTPPNSPVFEKLKAKAGREWFVKVSLPEAQVLVQQGTGRLIRSDTDRGVVAILDPRIGSKRWGSQIIQCLPEGMALTIDPTDVARFFGDAERLGGAA